METGDNRSTYFKATKTPLILDGAMGSYLHSQGNIPHPQLWFSHLNILNQEIVSSVHREYIEAGAEIITTNTFRTNPEAVRGTSFSPDELVKYALTAAKNARGDRNVLIAGSNPPSEDSYQKERIITHDRLQYNHTKHINLLVEAGCDFILNETQGHSDEIEIICRLCSENKFPFILSFYFDDDYKLLSGENLIEAVNEVIRYNPLAVGFNCISHSTFKGLLEYLEINYSWGFYLNYGLGNLNDFQITASSAPGTEKDIIDISLSKEVKFIGGCCGSGPDHIREIKKIIDAKYYL